MTFRFPLHTVGDRDDQSDLLLMRPPPEMGVRWPVICRSTQMDRSFVCEVKSLQWQRLQVPQDATA